MDWFGAKTQQLLIDAQVLLQQAQGAMQDDIRKLAERQSDAEARIDKLEKKHDEAVEQIHMLQKSMDDIRDSAIRGEIASGQKSKDTALKFGLSPARISQIAPRRRFNNG
ncbi:MULTISPECIES: hypothetical protein [Sphingomonas]|uniref:hypothetical protein n=1 Tax=Sphingomonas TaxID=13687 RepID=UPI00226BB02C|nr:hypothetical protein [Sphingomonas sp. GM_Shp_1]